MAEKKDDGKIRIEDFRIPSQLEVETAGEVLRDFWKWKNFRDGSFIQFQRNDFERVLTLSRELFWNAISTPSEDLRALDLEFSLPYVRKETLQFVSKLSSLNQKGRFKGEGLDIFGIKVLQGIYDSWRFHQNDRVEKFWETLYGVVNGTHCGFVGYNDGELTRRYLRSYDKESGSYNIEEKDEPYWNDVWSETVPIEDMYIPKVFERNFQKQGACIWKTEIPWKQFKSEFRNYDNAEFVYPGNMLAEDSLYYRLLAGSGVLGAEKVQLLKKYDWIEDKFVIYANAVLINPVGKGEKMTLSPMPFDHKMGPFTWSQLLPLDEKLAYGLPLPFLIKEPHRLLNTAQVMLMEHELRNVSPAILSSDFDSPKIIFGRHDVIPVNDVEAYKEFKLSDPTQAFFNMVNGLRTDMTDTAQGGQTPPMPSRQPKSAREALQLQQLQQQANAITLLMYYNMVRQQMILVIKTALQFYPKSKYKKQQKNILRAINVPNASLTLGGVGMLTVRITRKPKQDLELFFEALNQSFLNGKMTEIIEATPKVIQGLEFEITDIDLEPDQTDEMKKATWVEQVLNPMLQVYVPAGLADLSKVFLRHMEKLGEHPADYINEKILAQVMQTWQSTNSFQMPPAPAQGGQATTGAQSGNVIQSRVGTQFGSQNNQGIPQLAGVPA